MLSRKGYSFNVSSITEYEIYKGATHEQFDFWNIFLREIKVLPFDKAASQIAADIYKELKRKRNLIDTADLFIASTAVANNLPIATLNRKHFERIDGLKVIS